MVRRCSSAPSRQPGWAKRRCRGGATRHSRGLAARHLHYSQPSISHHIARLEVETGARLVQRVGRGIRLTAAGRLLAGRAEEILGRLETARLELAAHVGLSAGTVRIASFASGLLELMPPVIERLATEHPGLDLHLTDTHPPEALEMLRTGEADIALMVPLR